MFLRVQGQGHCGLTVHTTGLAIVVDLDEVVGVASFLGGTGQAGLTITLIFISFFLLCFVKYKRFGLFGYNIKSTMDRSRILSLDPIWILS